MGRDADLHTGGPGRFTRMIPENTAAGVIACAIAGLANGSFAVPMKRMTTWKWEHSWLVYSALAYGVLPVCLVLLLAHGIFVQIAGASASVALRVAGYGVLWGLGSLLFGLSLVRLGIAVANALVSSIIVLLGSLGPVLAGVAEISRRGLALFFLGLAPLIAGIALCAAASASRDQVRQEAQPGPRRPLAGILIAIAAGVLSSMLNVGFAVGQPLAQANLQRYSTPIATLAIWIPALAGGLAVNLVYTAWRIHRGGAWKYFYAAADAGSSWLRCAAMALLWFGAIFLYGYGASSLGQAGPVYGWAMLVGASILVSNLWGAATGEWRGAGRRSKALMTAATALLFSSFVQLAVQRAQEVR